MLRKKYIACFFSIALTAIVSTYGCNPFSPAIDDSLPKDLFGDAHTVDGFFQAFRAAYQFKDTVSYGKLLAPEFIFSYRNYDRGLDLQWGRDEEMRTTGSLFASSENLDLLWGNIIDSTGTDTVFDVTRAFSLDVTLNISDILHTDGRAVFHLTRPTKEATWQAVQWRDESNF